MLIRAQILRSNTDLIKKGLRPPIQATPSSGAEFKHRPDKEGIKTLLNPGTAPGMFKHRPDKEGIKTTSAPVSPRPVVQTQT